MNYLLLSLVNLAVVSVARVLALILSFSTRVFVSLVEL